MLLFGKKPRKFAFSSFVKIGKFGASDADLQSQEIVEGNAIELADRTLEILDKKYFIKAISYEGLQRIETPPYPYEAIREALFNSIIHREYENTPIMISLYEDRMMIWNQGELTDKLSIDDLEKKHPSYPRHKLLAGVFYKAGYIETWGRGTLKIIEECRAQGMPDPEIESKQGGFSVTLFQQQQIKLDSTKLNERQLVVMDYLHENISITNAKFREMFDVSERTALRDLEELVDLGLLRKEGAGRSTKYVSK